MQSDNCNNNIGTKNSRKRDIVISKIKMPMKRTEEKPFVMLPSQSRENAIIYHFWYLLKLNDEILFLTYITRNSYNMKV